MAVICTRLSGLKDRMRFWKSVMAKFWKLLRSKGGILSPEGQNMSKSWKSRHIWREIKHYIVQFTAHTVENGDRMNVLDPFFPRMITPLLTMTNHD